MGKNTIVAYFPLLLLLFATGSAKNNQQPYWRIPESVCANWSFLSFCNL